jgi:hypothetical protein
MPLFTPRDWPGQMKLDWQDFAYAVSEWSRVSRMIRGINEISKIQKVLNKAGNWVSGHGKAPTEDDLSTLRAELYNLSKEMEEIRVLLDTEAIPTTVGLQEWLEYKMKKEKS